MAMDAIGITNDYVSRPSFRMQVRAMREGVMSVALDSLVVLAVRSIVAVGLPAPD